MATDNPEKVGQVTDAPNATCPSCSGPAFACLMTSCATTCGHFRSSVPETKSADEIIEACIKAVGDALPACKNSDECPLWYDGCHCPTKGDDNKVVMAMRALKGKFVLPAEVSPLTGRLCADCGAPATCMDACEPACRQHCGNPGCNKCGVQCVGCERGRCEAPKDDGPHDHMCDRCDAAVAGVERCACCAADGDPEGLCSCVDGCPGRGSNHGWEHSGDHK